MTLEELGALLRDERERRGLTIEEVATHLKYGSRKLRALEEGDTASMPVPYLKGFIRAYATFLGLAASEVVEAMRVVGDQRPTAEEIRAAHQARQGTTPVERRSSPLVPLLVVGVLVVALAGGTWAALRAGRLDGLRERLPESLRTSLPERRADMPESIPDMSRPARTAAVAEAERPAKPAAAPASPAPAAKAPAGVAAVAPRAAGGAARSSAAPAAPVVTAASAASGSGPARTAADGALSVHSGGEAVPAAVGNAAGERRAVLSASRPCRIRSRADGADAREFSLNRGDVFVLTYGRRLELALDDPTCVRIRQDGREVPIPSGGGALVLPAGGSGR